jgi:hypothetical protein
MEPEKQSCPVLTLEIFKQGFKPGELTDEQIKVIYDGLRNERKEYMEEVEAKGGRKKKKQYGGVKCDVLHTIFKYSLLLVVVGGSSYFFGSQYFQCMYSEDSVKLAEYLKWLWEDLRNKKHFAHFYDILGKVFSLGMGNLDKFTSYLKECLINPDKKAESCTFNWLKNVFEIFCSLDKKEIKLEDAKKKLEGVVTAEAVAVEQAAVNDMMVYDGKKEVQIVVGDAIITIKPNIPMTTAEAVQQVVAEEGEDDEDEFHDAIDLMGNKGGKRRKRKTNKKKKKRNTRRKSVRRRRTRS